MADKTSSRTSSSELGTWDGSEDTYPQAIRTITAYKRRNKKKFKGYFGAVNPKERTRIKKTYRVPEPDSDDSDDESDPTGARPGQRVYRESKEDYRRAKRVYKEHGVTWFYILAAMFVGGLAEERVQQMESTDELDGKLLEKRVRADYESKTNKHSSHLFRGWVTNIRPSKTTMTEWNRQWNRTAAVINQNMEWQQMQVYLYMMSLGPVMRQFYNITTAGSAKLKLTDVQKAAEDWCNDEQNEDEGKPSQIAFAAQQQNSNSNIQPRAGKYGPGDAEWKQRPCVLCSHPFHAMNECFRPGGGLAHLTAAEREQWLDMKWKSKGNTGPRPTKRPRTMRVQTPHRHGHVNEEAMMAKAREDVRKEQEVKHIKERVKDVLESHMLSGVVSELGDVLK